MNVDLVISLRDIDVQTASVMGKDACAFEWCGADSKRDPDTILFAYEKGTTWETTLVDPAPGQYRITMLSNTLFCSQIVSIDDDVLNNGVRFDRAKCRRKRTPLFLKRC